MYELDILIAGFPGKTATHGGLGWSTVALLRDGERTILVDTGPPAYLAVLHKEFERLGIDPADITHILATHLHWDHVGNFTMFPNATVIVGRHEFEWASVQPAGTPLIPDLHVRRLAETLDSVVLVEESDDILPGVSALFTPGHTPGHLTYRVSTVAGDVLFAGDAVKNRYELATGTVDSSLDFAVSRASVERLRDIMEADPAIIMIPGHDVRLASVNGKVEALDVQAAQFSVYLDTEVGESVRVIT
jgi:glyoxylase-like metal-dependent hydrolase (beta-lactamase superfamily II)